MGRSLLLLLVFLVACESEDGQGGRFDNKDTYKPESFWADLGTDEMAPAYASQTASERTVAPMAAGATAASVTGTAWRTSAWTR